MSNYEHWTKQTYESYTFQPLMSFCGRLMEDGRLIAEFHARARAEPHSYVNLPIPENSVIT